MIFWHTDNEISQIVASHLVDAGHTPKHIRDFNYIPPQPSIFYGIMRGTGRAMHLMNYLGLDYYYLDNGYTDAQYINENKQKHMTGTYRVVKGAMIEKYAGKLTHTPSNRSKIALVLPPSIYTANHFDTTPEDWVQSITQVLARNGYSTVIRDKTSRKSLDEDLDGAGIVVNFNSMAGMRALERGIPVYDSHWIFSNAHDLFKPEFEPQVYADYADVKAFYEPKQFTLEQLRSWNA